MYESVLELLKYDLSIRNTSRDDYMLTLIESSADQIKSYGVDLDLDTAADAMFLSDWCAWKYRNRVEGKDLPNNLRLRLNDRIIRARAARYESKDTS